MSRDPFEIKLCGCIMESSMKELPGLLSHGQVGLLEWRLDSFILRQGTHRTLEMLPLLSSSERNPVVVTNRHRVDGGFFDSEDEERIEILARAAQAGAEWVDLEDRLQGDVFVRFKSMGKRLLISHHDFSGTPSTEELRRTVERMAQAKLDVIKIATLARKPDDNLRVLELIPFGRNELDVDVLAFCMGPIGRWSRAVCTLLGSPWTYVQMPGQSAAAPGQYSLAQMRSLGELLWILE